ncbi:MAG: sodium/solute symporter [Bacteroidota bacterium]
MNFATTDLVVLIGYLLLMMGFGIWIANREKNESAKDYFLASSALPWWAVGGSLIASNISTEQILGMNGSGYVMGLAIGAYELMAALTLIIVAKFLLPVFINKGIYTMPQFLEERYDRRVRTIMAFFWVTLFVLVNISSVLYLGALAIQNIFGFEWVIDLAQVSATLQGVGIATANSVEEVAALINSNPAAFGEGGLNQLLDAGAIAKDYNFPLLYGILGLVLYSATLSIFGGLKAVVWTDVIQVIILVVGGFIAAYMVLSFVGDGSAVGGLGHLYDKAPDHFDMILDKTNASYDKLPGISVLIGGLWIANLYYWGTNQYIIQRALASTSLQEAQRGVAFAAAMKLIIPFFAVVPGIAAYVILQDPAAYGFAGAGNDKPDEAFPWVLSKFLQVGFKGLVLAALIAAIGSSVSSMVNSASTIFTLDIYKNLFVPDNSDEHYVSIGRLSATGALVLGAIIAPMLGSLEQVFQYIQEYTGFISPGIVAVFIFGMFWKRATSNGAFAAVLLSIPFSWFMQTFFPDVPFLVRMALSFVVMCMVIVGVALSERPTSIDQPARETSFLALLVASILIISVPAGIRIFLGDIETNVGFGVIILGMAGIIFAILFLEKRDDDAKAFQFSRDLFKTEGIFNLTAVFVLVVLAVIYYVLW